MHFILKLNLNFISFDFKMLVVVLETILYYPFTSFYLGFSVFWEKINIFAVYYVI